MDRVDGFYLYTGGQSLKPLERLAHDTKLDDAYLPVYVARGWLKPVIKGESIFHLKTSWSKGNALLSALEAAISEIESTIEISKSDSSSPKLSDKELGWLRAHEIKSSLTAFETVLAAEWNLADLFLVKPVPGYDTSALIENGIILFPQDLRDKVPEAVSDANDFGKCVAFRLPSAAGFHLHRINESVLGHYYDHVTGGKPRPRNKTIGGYLKELQKHNKGDAKVMAALDSLRELHRNPLMHPRESLGTVDEAVSLYGAIQSVMVHMLKAIPKPKP